MEYNIKVNTQHIYDLISMHGMSQDEALNQYCALIKQSIKQCIEREQEQDE